MISKQAVEQAIDVFNKKVLELRKKKPAHDILPKLMIFSKNTIASWIEWNIDNTEEDGEYNEKVMGVVLDWISILIKITKEDDTTSENFISKSKLKRIIKEILKASHLQY